MRFVLFVMVAMATYTMGVSTSQPKEPTEDQEKEVVFEVSKEMVAEVNAAVQTVNKIFGNPTCEEKKSAEDDNKSERSTERRFWFGKKRDEDNKSNRSAERRFWFGKKRDEGSMKRMVWFGKKRDTGSMKRMVWFGRKRDTSKAVQKKSDLTKAALVICNIWCGKKRDAPEHEEYERAIAQAQASDNEEVQFRADVAELREAVKIFNGVLEVAEAGLDN